VVSEVHSFLRRSFEIFNIYLREMADKDGPTIAGTFYQELFCGPDGTPVLQPDTTKSAQALHAAVKKLCSQNVSFSAGFLLFILGNEMFAVLLNMFATILPSG
jgi:hypothetical protein